MIRAMPAPESREKSDISRLQDAITRFAAEEGKRVYGETIPAPMPQMARPFEMTSSAVICLARNAGLR